ncbi:9218_t:CDS:2 [Paraglomus brasilianum]|uniref:glutathione gamma-glutamylcysteinyltransferase n=1 Tax=Paraglomus brasilianum TaxID=144538 RepID=A0A9N8VXH0_9GLOM|nr:9218_t:CDS:2 [Paraglomus brasilianum]
MLYRLQFVINRSRIGRFNRSYSASGFRPFYDSRQRKTSLDRNTVGKQTLLEKNIMNESYIAVATERGVIESPSLSYLKIKPNPSSSTTNSTDANIVKPKQYFQGRELPSFLISLTSKEGKELIKESLNQGYAEGFFDLSSCFSHQMEPAYCALSSLAIVLNALQVQGAPVWKGPWRWWYDELLNCCQDIEKVKQSGTTFSQFTCLAKCHCEVHAKRADQVTKEEFVNDLKYVNSTPGVYMVISFSRATLSQTGDGHFSPIGAYLPEKNMALVLDTARFKYPSYFASVDLLYESMFPIDKVTQQPRGYFLLSQPSDSRKDLMCNMDCDASALQTSWSALEKALCENIPKRILDEKPQSMEELATVVMNSPFITSLQHAIDMDCGNGIGETERVSREQYINAIIKETTLSPIYPAIQKALQEVPQEQHRKFSDYEVAFATLFLLAIPSSLYKNVQPELLAKFDAYRDRTQMSPVLRKEVERMGEEIKELVVNFCTCGVAEKILKK